jgi:hypothetical protein
MIIDHVEEDHQTQFVRRVDQRLQRVRRAIGRIGRIRQHPVVTPIAPAREIVDRHQFDRGDAKFLQSRQPLRHAGKSAAGADMKLVEHGLAPRPPAPVRIAPRVGTRIDHDAWANYVINLRACRRVGHQRAVRQAVAIARACGAGRGRCKPAIRRALHRQQRTTFQRHAHGLLRRRPQMEPRVPVCQQLRTMPRIAGKTIAHSASSSQMA